MAITLQQAKSLQQGQTLYHTKHRNADGSPQRWRVTSVKTWKTRPNDVRIGVKHGLRNYDTIGPRELALVHLTEASALGTSAIKYQALRWGGYAGSEGPVQCIMADTPADLLAQCIQAIEDNPVTLAPASINLLLAQHEDGYWDFYYMPWEEDQAMGNDATWHPMDYAAVDLLFGPAVRNEAQAILAEANAQ